MGSSRGFILIESLIVIMIISVFVALAVPNLLKSRAASNEVSAVSSVRTIVSSQFSYAMRSGGYSSSLLTFRTSQLLDSVLGSGTKNGLTFISSSGSNTVFTVNARPMANGSSGSRSFFADESGVIRYTTADADETSTDTPICGPSGTYRVGLGRAPCQRGACRTSLQKLCIIRASELLMIVVEHWDKGGTHRTISARGSEPRKSNTESR